MSVAGLTSAARSAPTIVRQVSPSRRNFGTTLGIAFGLLIAMVPVLGTKAAIPFALVLFPLVVWTAFTNTERGLYLYIGWCWFDGTIRGVFGDNPFMVVARDIVLAIITIGWLLQRKMVTSDDPVKVPPFSILVVFFVVDCFLQIFNPYNLGIVTSLGGLKLILSAVPLYYIGYDVFRNKTQVKNLAMYVTTICVITSLVFLLQYSNGRAWTFTHFPGTDKVILTDLNIDRDPTDDHSDMDVRNFRPPGCGTIGGCTGFSDAISLPFVFALLLSMVEKKAPIKARIGVVALVVLYVVVIFLSGGRSSLYFAIDGSVLCAWFCGSKHRRTAIIVLLLCVGAGLASWGISSNASSGAVNTRWTSTLINPVKATNEDRQTFFDQFPTLAVNSPLGVGIGRTGAIGAYDNVVREKLSFSAFSESQYGTLILQTGLPGLILIVALTIGIIRTSLKFVARSSQDEDRFYAAAILAALIAIAINNIVMNLLLGPPGTIFYWLFGAIMLRVYRPQRKVLMPISDRFSTTDTTRSELADAVPIDES